MASPSSFSSIFFIRKTHLLISILLYYSTRISPKEAIKAPIHPQQVLPLLPDQVSLPILNSFRSIGNLQVTYVGSAKIADAG
ncbi:hypothetical protein OSB04_006133 [Centaurea solstitialis]|uniref:Uncharacterized protein n=1 Tax=Centaurea solstitialis TaxID=347529 RepID=A0AA38TPX4_9ASTR|nr:hypothetical protein OSB04_006133 [Centaurea solstitialis]